MPDLDDCEFAPWLGERLRNNPEFRAAFARVTARFERKAERYRRRSAMVATAPLPIDGRAYTRKLRARRRRR